MKKIMFNDSYGLTNAVLTGKKTMTRRICCNEIQQFLERQENRKIGIVPVDILPPQMSIEEFVEEWEKYSGNLIFIDDKAKSKIKYITPSLKNILNDLADFSPYKVGEELAVAQSYKELIDDGYFRSKNGMIPVEYGESAGYRNKMFVNADLMPHRIRITDVKAEPLQNISDDDCMKEGIYYDNPFPELSDPNVYAFSVISKKNRQTTWWSPTPRIAFENLIIHMMGKKVWESNPYVWAYTFELVK